MRRFRGVYLFIAGLTVAGSALLLADSWQSSAADSYRAAAQCADTSSAGCYQLYPGLIQGVRITQTSTGRRDEVIITSRQTSLRVSLTPSESVAALVQPGTAVTVEWYVGTVTTVWIADQGIPTTSNPLGRANFAYVGWILIWLAAFFGVLTLMSRRLAAAVATPRLAGVTEWFFGAAGSQVLLPIGTVGWSIRPRLKQVVAWPLLFTAVALISIRPFMNADRIEVASISDVLLFLCVMVSLILTFRNSRVMADRPSLMRVDWLRRIRTWPLEQVDQLAWFFVRGSFSDIPCLAFIGEDGSELFSLSNLFWDLDEIQAFSVAIGIRVTSDYYLTRARPINRKRRAVVLAISLASAGVLAWSFLPLPE